MDNKVKKLNFVEIYQTFCKTFGGGYVGYGDNFFGVLSNFLEYTRNKIADYYIYLEENNTIPINVKSYYMDKCKEFLKGIDI